MKTIANVVYKSGASRWQIIETAADPRTRGSVYPEEGAVVAYGSLEGGEIVQTATAVALETQNDYRDAERALPRANLSTAQRQCPRSSELLWPEQILDSARSLVTVTLSRCPDCGANYVNAHSGRERHP